MTPRRSNPPVHKRRVPVPRDLAREMLAFRTKREALATLGVSEHTYDDAVMPGGLLQPSVLARIEAALAAHKQKTTAA